MGVVAIGHAPNVSFSQKRSFDQLKTREFGRPLTAMSGQSVLLISV